jgi:hypothetical protein
VGKKVALVASRTLSLAEVFPWALEELRELPEGSWVHLRKAMRGSASQFSLAMAVLATELELNVRWFRPGSGGRQATFIRDVEMVAASDEVVAYFAEGEEMGVESGTAHVVEKALDQGKTCRAYVIIDGDRRLVGSHDAEDQA